MHISNAKAALDQTLLHANKIRAVINGLCNRLILFYLTPFLCFVFFSHQGEADTGLDRRVLAGPRGRPALL